MKERPILFNTDMVRALLDGRKTQTRRVVKPQPYMNHDSRAQGNTNLCPYGQIGDRLWVRETWAYVPKTAYAQSTGVHQIINPNNPDMAAVYKAGWERCAPSWKPSIHMQRWASRLTLEVTDVRVERVQDISEEDAKAEGCPVRGNIDATKDPIGWFAWLWDSINAKRGYSWDSNPWVWVVAFKLIKNEETK